MSKIVLNKVRTHEAKVILLFAKISALGENLGGAEGLLCGHVVGSGEYTFTTTASYPIHAWDLTNADMTPQAFGTGVTKTCCASVCLLDPDPEDTSERTIAVTGPVLNADYSVSFVVNTSKDGASFDLSFSFRAVISATALGGK